MSNTSRGAFVREDTVFTKTWPSASAATATADDMVPLLEDSVNVTNDQRAIVTRGTPGGPGAPKVTRTRTDGAINVIAAYEGLEFLFTAALGLEANRIDGVLMPEELVVGTVYRHLIEIDDKLEGTAWQAGEGFVAGANPIGDGLIAGQQKMRRGTLTTDRDITVWDARSQMINTLAVQAAPQGVALSAGVLGYDMNYISAVNAGLSALTCDPEQILFAEGTFEIRLASDIDFTSATLLVPAQEFNGIRFTLSNGLRAVTTRDTSPNIDEPRRRLAPTLAGAFSMPRTTDISLLEANRDTTKLSARLRFEGGFIGATDQKYTLTFWFPSITLTGGDSPVSGPVRERQNYSFIADVPDVMPVDFPSSVQPGMMLIEIINTISEHPLL